MEKIIIDGKNSVLGRISSYAAKQALLGKEIVVVNCGEIAISGNPKTTIEIYKIKRKRGGSSQKGPDFPKSPERIVKRTIGKMLSYTLGRGLNALKKITCYDDVPLSYTEAKKILIEKDLKTSSIKLKELSNEI